MVVDTLNKEWISICIHSITALMVLRLNNNYNKLTYCIFEKKT